VKIGVFVPLFQCFWESGWQILVSLQIALPIFAIQKSQTGFPSLSRKCWNSGTNPFFLNTIKHLRVPVDFQNWNKTGTNP
jgi:hypothetical protein